MTNRVRRPLQARRSAKATPEPTAPAEVRTRRPQARDTKSFNVEMSLEKETPGTYRYAADDEDATIPTIYIKKAAFPKGAPASIVVSIIAG